MTATMHFPRLTADAWRARAAAHAERIEALTSNWQAVHRRGQKHAIEDFLFTYYNAKPAQLKRWSPGAGIALDAAAHDDIAGRRWFTTTSDGSVSLNAATFYADRGGTVDYIEFLTKRILDRPARLGCFGLHEWAMVYRADEKRHPLPLRLGPGGTDAVVENNPIQCSHIDAFRFLTPAAKPRNALQPTRETQPDLDQSGCLHANMDVYKWALKLGPAAPGELVADAFELARDIRWVDMRASPYDVTGFGVGPIQIETPEGKREYAELQSAFGSRANALRERTLDAIAALRRAIDASPS